MNELFLDIWDMDDNSLLFAQARTRTSKRTLLWKFELFLQFTCLHNLVSVKCMPTWTLKSWFMLDSPDFMLSLTDFDKMESSVYLIALVLIWNEWLMLNMICLVYMTWNVCLNLSNAWIHEMVCYDCIRRWSESPRHLHDTWGTPKLIGRPWNSSRHGLGREPRWAMRFTW